MDFVYYNFLYSSKIHSTESSTNTKIVIHKTKRILKVQQVINLLISNSYLLIQLIANVLFILFRKVQASGAVCIMREHRSL